VDHELALNMQCNFFFCVMEVLIDILIYMLQISVLLDLQFGLSRALYKFRVHLYQSNCEGIV
jgi:hypothetical protein